MPKEGAVITPATERDIVQTGGRSYAAFSTDGSTRTLKEIINDWKGLSRKLERGKWGQKNGLDSGWKKIKDWWLWQSEVCDGSHFGRRRNQEEEEKHVYNFF